MRARMQQIKLSPGGDHSHRIYSEIVQTEGLNFDFHHLYKTKGQIKIVKWEFTRAKCNVENGRA